MDFMEFMWISKPESVNFICIQWISKPESTESTHFIWMQWISKPESTESADLLWILWTQAWQSTVNLWISCKSTDLYDHHQPCGFSGFHQPKIHEYMPVIRHVPIKALSWSAHNYLPVGHLQSLNPHCPDVGCPISKCRC